jgi:hypothetical protein
VKEDQMINEAKVGITIAITLSITTLTVLLSGIIITELNNSNEIYKAIRESTQVIANISTVVAVAVGIVAYKNWKMQLITERSIKSIELATHAISKVQMAFIQASNAISYSDCRKTEEILKVVEMLKQSKKDINEVYHDQELKYSKPLINKEIRRELMTLNAFCINKRLTIELFILQLKPIFENIKRNSYSLEYAGAISNIETTRNECITSYDDDMKVLSSIRKKLIEIGMKI